MSPFNREATRLRSVFTNKFFIYLVIIGNIILFSTTGAFYFVEKDINPMLTGYFDSFWWGVSTITTVGYGDIVPLTNTGKVIGLILMYSGTVLFIGITGLIVSLWMRAEVQREIYPLEKEVEREEIETLRVEQTLKEINQRLKRIELR